MKCSNEQTHYDPKPDSRSPAALTDALQRPHRLNRDLYFAPVGPICVLIVMASILSGRDRLAFRDVSHFYTPLYQFVAEQTAQFGQLSPLWNSFDQTGLPLAGETTTAVYYPVRAVVYGFGGSADMSMAWYVAIHLILASLTAYLLARWQRFSAPAAGCVSVLYPISGSVLFLATNPPYLVSAAWLPLAIAPLFNRNTKRSHRSCVLAGVAMAMMTLGGDPPTVLHVVLLSIVVRVLQATLIGILGTVSQRSSWQGCMKAVLKELQSFFGSLCLSIVMAVCLSAPQLASSVDWASQSDRNLPRSNSETLAYSVAPWRIVELFMPNAFGCPWPIHTRWDRLAFSDHPQDPHLSLWTPTLYIGSVLPLCVLSLIRFAWRRGWNDTLQRSTFLWSVLVILAAWCSIGSFGGLYEWMVDRLPGYQTLRYPSKWLPFVSLGLAMLMGRGMEMIAQNRRRLIPSWTLVVVLTTGVMFASSWTIHGVHKSPNQVSDEFWGPLRMDVAMADLATSAVHVAIVFLSLRVILSLRSFGKHVRSSLLLAVFSLDLLIAHRSLIPRIDSLAESDQSMQMSLPATTFDTTDLWMRNEVHGGWPEAWRETSDANRMVEVEAVARACWWGRWHLLDRARVFNSSTSIRAAELKQFWIAAQKVSQSIPSADRPDLWLKLESWLGVNGRITLDHTGEPIVTTSLRPSIESLQLTVRSDTSSLETHSQWLKLIQEIQQSSEPIPLQLPNEAFDSKRQESYWLMRRVFQDGHWKALIRPNDTTKSNDAPEKPGPWQPRTVFRANGVHQAISLPPGRWSVQFVYQPWWHTSSMIISLGAWSILLASPLIRKLKVSRALR